MFLRIYPRALKLIKPNEDLRHLFYAGVIRRAAVSVMSLFSPIFVYLTLLKNGFPQRMSIAGVGFYYLLLFALKLITFIISEDLSRKIGFKHNSFFAVCLFHTSFGA